MKGYRSCRSKTFVLLSLLWIGVTSASAMERHLAGDRTLPTTKTPAPGLLLMAAGEPNPEGVRWFLDRAAHGHIVVLQAAAADTDSKPPQEWLDGAASVETFRFSGRADAEQPQMLASLQKADGIYIADAPISRYLELWRGTAVEKLLQAHVLAGKPLAGTEAGLTVQDEALRDTMVDGRRCAAQRSCGSPERDRVPGNLLDLPWLRGVVTDDSRHGGAPLERLLDRVAQAREQAKDPPTRGLAMDRGTALAIGPDGRSQVFASASGGGVMLVRRETAPAATHHATVSPGNVDGIVETIRLDAASVLHLPGGKVDRSALQHRYAMRQGVWAVLERPLLVIHGGAGVTRASINAEEEAAARAALKAALRAGHEQLRAGKPALDAVAAAVVLLEDSPYFNAGRGAVFTHEGRNELDAAVMDGASGKAGAVAGVGRIKNPIKLARAVMQDSPHVMMVGSGAEAFARKQGIELVDPAYFHTDKRWQQLQDQLRVVGNKLVRAAGDGRQYFGTVGALALDRSGHVAAGTSTGGMVNKRYGRVGDSPIIGAGTWADRRCAVSGTGWGEFYIRAAAAHEICARVRLAGESLRVAATAVIDHDIPAAGGDGGAIALDAMGNIAFPFNTEGMYRGWIGADGVPHVAVFADESLPLP